MWSFGILLWEVIMFGASPYPDIESKDVLAKLEEGYRMPQPKNCSAEMYVLMFNCWKMRSEERYSTPPHLHTSTPPHLHTSTPPHLHIPPCEIETRMHAHLHMHMRTTRRMVCTCTQARMPLRRTPRSPTQPSLPCFAPPHPAARVAACTQMTIHSGLVRLRTFTGPCNGGYSKLWSFKADNRPYRCVPALCVASCR